MPRQKKKRTKLIMKFCEVQNQHLFTQLLLSAPSRHALEIFFQMGENKPFFKKYSWVQTHMWLFKGFKKKQCQKYRRGRLDRCRPSPFNHHTRPNPPIQSRAWTKKSRQAGARGRRRGHAHALPDGMASLTQAGRQPDTHTSPSMLFF